MFMSGGGGSAGEGTRGAICMISLWIEDGVEVGSERLSIESYSTRTERHGEPHSTAHTGTSDHRACQFEFVARIGAEQPTSSQLYSFSRCPLLIIACIVAASLLPIAPVSLSPSA